MSRLEDLLNPVVEVDLWPQLEVIGELLAKAPEGPILIISEKPSTVCSRLYLDQRLSEETHDVFITKCTTLATLYRYSPDTYMEYPETGQKPVGHLFQLDPKNWVTLSLDFAYSLGIPSGRSKKTEEITCPILADRRGNLVQCIKSHSTCQGIKACPFNDMDELTNVFLRTAAYLTTVRNQGCGKPLFTTTIRTEEQQDEFEQHQNRLKTYRRGYVKPEMCQGRILCEHYSTQNKNYWADFTIGNGLYDLEYISAICSDDKKKIEAIEEAARQDDYGPLAPCSFLCNFSAKRLNCRGSLVRVECSCTVKIYEPVEEQRESCPFFTGHSSRCSPLPEKTPKKIRDDIFNLLAGLSEDLPDMTPRGFLRHPTVQAYLRDKLPDQAQSMHFPKGTGWEGKLLWKHFDQNVDPENHYIRKILHLDDNSLPIHEEDELPEPSQKNRTRIIICMSPEGSRRLHGAQYLQSDIAFRRIVGFLEFKLACIDRDANTTLVRSDTGSRLQWCHLAADTVHDFEDMILHWVADQHRGQAKGLGPHLQALAQQLGNKMDLHEPGRSLASLTPYEHLSRVYRMCTVHVSRRIKTCAVSDKVKKLMRSLICLQHSDWNATILKIWELGGKAGSDWINDKESSKFIFPGICWEKSHIPLVIWQARDQNSNLVETVHRDVNREGVHCTLLGGVIKGQHYDSMKMKTLQAYETSGIRPTYKPVHLVVNMTKNLKRKSTQQAKVLEKADNKITAYNTKMTDLHGKVNQHKRSLHKLYEQLDRPESDAATIQTRIAIQQEQKASESFANQIKIGRDLKGTGSGRIQVLLP
ncbi:hypothetical protein C8R45DRAFT_1056526 [Mycena sanguinolenta]|nr:hypothetical protein C8R45DRAFT_1056526 [Mycena sanguinolenta]